MPVLVFGQTISGVSGEMSHNTTVTISGSGFGTVTPGPDIIFDNMESGNWDSRLEPNGLEMRTASRHGNSSHCAGMNFGGAAPSKHGYFSYRNTHDLWYTSYWYALDQNWNWGTSGDSGGDGSLANVKTIRFHQLGGCDPCENAVMATMYYGGTSKQWSIEHVSDAGSEQYFDGSGEADGGMIGSISSSSVLEWHHVQVAFRECSAPGVADGAFHYWRDGLLRSTNSATTTQEDEGDKFPFIVGFYNSWGDSHTDDDDFYIDDVFISSTWARVELGDDPDYQSCSHREIQPVSSWSTSAVDITVNTGTYIENDLAYLFVIAEDGTSSAGYAVTIGQSGGGGPMTPPTNLQASGGN